MRQSETIGGESVFNGGSIGQSAELIRLTSDLYRRRTSIAVSLECLDQMVEQRHDTRQPTKVLVRYDPCRKVRTLYVG